MINKKIILASASPRRKELLKQIAVDFEIIVSDADEDIEQQEVGLAVEELSRRKAFAVYDKCDADSLIIGADTVVALGDRILGKPKDESEAEQMLGELQGCTHSVYTGVTLLYTENGEARTRCFHEKTDVTFFPMTRSEILEYIATKDPFDKAGSYGIQGFCARYIREIKGDYNNVVGLPVGRLYQELSYLEGKKRIPEAVIFDLDGTLSDSIKSLKFCGDTVLSKYGYGPFTEDQYKLFVGDGAANMMKRALIAGGDTGLQNFDAVLKDYLEFFKDNCMYQVKPYDGIRELIAHLKKNGIKTAVLSNKPHLETINVLNTLFGEDTFDIILGQQDGIKIKPSPEGVYIILDKLGLSASQVFYLGDTGTDMKTGKSAGLFTVGALWGFRDRKELMDNHADMIIKTPGELYV